LPSIFSEAQVAQLSRLHVSRGQFLEVALPTGTRRFHDGFGRVTVGGHVWEGVSNPFGEGQISGTLPYQAPRLGTLPKVTIALIATDLAFLKSIRDLVGFYGLSANLYWGLFDAETQQAVGDLVLVFEGKLSNYTISRKNRVVTFDLDGPLQSLQSPYGDIWNPAQQRRRFAGDKGMDFLGEEKEERIT
jgi:hypothetical protein